MKKMCARLWAGALLLVFLSGCSSKGEGRTAEEWTELYQQVITEHGGEMVEYNPVISRFDAEDGTSALALSSLGLEEGGGEGEGGRGAGGVGGARQPPAGEAHQAAVPEGEHRLVVENGEIVPQLAVGDDSFPGGCFLLD